MQSCLDCPFLRKILKRVHASYDLIQRCPKAAIAPQRYVLCAG